MGESQLTAIEAAFGLVRMPALATRLQAQPLPHEISVVLHVAAGIEPEVREVCRKFSCSESDARAIARIYLQQVALFPGADSHRILCGSTTSSLTELRRNKNLLVRWLHPDMNGNSWEALLLPRVLAAWDELGRQYPPAPQGRRHRRSLPAGSAQLVRWIPHTVSNPQRRPRSSLWLWRTGIFVLVLVVLAGVIYVEFQRPELGGTWPRIFSDPRAGRRLACPAPHRSRLRCLSRTG